MNGWVWLFVFSVLRFIKLILNCIALPSAFRRYFSKIGPPQRARPPGRVSVNESMNQLNRTLQTLLIPEATNREPTRLIDVVPVNIAEVVVQGAEPGA